MAKEQQKIEEGAKKQYKSPILYLHKSKAGGHLFAFNVDKQEEGEEGEEDGMVLGNKVESLILNVSDVEAVIGGSMKWCKVSVVLKGDAE